MSACPSCRQDTLLEAIDSPSGFIEHACSVCSYYDSNSPAYVYFPKMFNSLGRKVLANLQCQLTEHVLADFDAKAWLKNEPDFTKRIVTPLDRNSRQTKRYQNLVKRLWYLFVG